jgi:hypothetical protein
MAMNRIQLQPGLSLTEFLEQYGTEERCEQALEQDRWTDGYRCENGSDNKIPFTAAVEVDDADHPVCVRSDRRVNLEVMLTLLLRAAVRADSRQVGWLKMAELHY